MSAHPLRRDPPRLTVEVLPIGDLQATKLLLALARASEAGLKPAAAEPPLCETNQEIVARLVARIRGHVETEA